MRDCLNFWMRQWYLKPHKDGTEKPTKVSYEDALIGVYSDMIHAVINKENCHLKRPDEILSEDIVKEIFNSEFSCSWDDCKSAFVPKQIFKYKIIANYHEE